MQSGFYVYTSYTAISFPEKLVYCTRQSNFVCAGHCAVSAHSKCQYIGMTHLEHPRLCEGGATSSFFRNFHYISRCRGLASRSSVQGAAGNSLNVSNPLVHQIAQLVLQLQIVVETPVSQLGTDAASSTTVRRRGQQMIAPVLRQQRQRQLLRQPLLRIVQHHIHGVEVRADALSTRLVDAAALQPTARQTWSQFANQFAQ